MKQLQTPRTQTVGSNKSPILGIRPHWSLIYSEAATDQSLGCLTVPKHNKVLKKGKRGRALVGRVVINVGGGAQQPQMGVLLSPRRWS